MHNFYARIAEAAERFPNRPAIECVGGVDGETTSYQELLDGSGRVASWLTRQTVVAPGDRVAILAANDARWIAVYLGALRLGAVVVPLDTAYTARQVHTILADSGARVLFTTARYLDTARDAAALCESPAPRVVLTSGSADGISNYSELMAAPAAFPPVEVGAQDAAVILYTSGTTADPKGVVLTHANLDAERAAVLGVVSASEADVVLGVLPLFHALAQMANLLLPLTIGARVVFLDTVSSTSLLDALQTRGVTILACVPQFFYLIHQRVMSEFGRRGAMTRGVLRALIWTNRVLRDHVGWNPGRVIFARVHHALGPHMRLLITGGSRFDPGIARDLYGLGVSLYNGYGLTETSGAASIVRSGDRFTTSVGQPLPGVEVRVQARGLGSEAREGLRAHGSGLRGREEGTEDTGDAYQDGEILIRGPIVMREYWRRPEATAEVLDEGWLHTGDLGRIDDRGRLHITGRKKELIVLSSGKNIYPEEIEAHYRQSVFIRELAVLGLTRPDQPAAERLHAVIVPDEHVMRERGIVNIRELVRFELESLSVQLPAHKRILSYDISLDPLPRTSTGKLRRTDIERHARERASAASANRPMTDSEREWLQRDDRMVLLTALSASLRLGQVNPDANLELDLGLDSMERVELLTTLEARNGTRVAADVRAQLFTVRQLVDAVIDAPSAGAPGKPSAPGDATLPWDTVLAEPADPTLVHELGRSKFARALVIFLLLRIVLTVTRIVIGFRVTGRDHIPADGPFIISPNHQTFLDGFFVAAALPFRAFRRIFFVGAAEFLETRFMAWGARAINIVPVDPDANLVNAMRAAATGLALGKVLMLFPEGERSIDGSIKPFRKGAAILASHLEVPIVPAAIDGLFHLWPRGRPIQWTGLLPWRRRRVSLGFGPPLEVARGAYASGTDALQQAVEGLRASLLSRPENDSRSSFR